MITTPADIRPFANTLQKQFLDHKAYPAFQVDCDPDLLWEVYLNSFPKGSDPVFKERSEHDCTTCRHFVKRAGGMVWVVNNQLVSLWDVEIGGVYQIVADALSKYVKSLPIKNIFLSSEPKIGNAKNYDYSKAGDLFDSKAPVYYHFELNLPQNLVSNNLGQELGKFKINFEMLSKALELFSNDTVEIVIDLIKQDSLYRGAEKLWLLESFLKIRTEFNEVPLQNRENFIWVTSVQNPNICGIKNDVIGTLLQDLAEGKDLENAVRAYETKVAGDNYQRPKALITPKMKEAAKKTLTDLDLLGSLNRRVATLKDIPLEEFIYVDRSHKKESDIFDSLPVVSKTKKLEGLIEISIEDFLEKVVPSAKTIELLLDSKHNSNFISLVTAEDMSSKSLFKWDNPFSWSYVGEVADSIKQKVKKAGGNVTGLLCCRLAWFNTDDLDLSFQGPSNQIYYANKSRWGGELDVDMNVTKLVTDPVENIYFNDLNSIPNGEYILNVHQFTLRNPNTNPGFSVEIEYEGKTTVYNYPNLVKGNVNVAKIIIKDKKATIVPLIPESKSASQEVWGLNTNEFVKVKGILLSPNFWNNQQIGNKHYIFALENCINPENIRGFYNEFLHSSLNEHKKAMEVLGSIVKAESTIDQVSGLGFSSTKSDDFIVRVTGSHTRLMNVKI